MRGCWVTVLLVRRAESFVLVPPPFLFRGGVLFLLLGTTGTTPENGDDDDDDGDSAAVAVIPPPPVALLLLRCWIFVLPYPFGTTTTGTVGDEPFKEGVTFGGRFAFTVVPVAFFAFTFGVDVFVVA
mmetsp:Transcript_52832/g.61020  ORF Transcript_52832/g.61020 Transcript_52832/m.61020 type:complete len:127 (+) Transcript_52832:308-688(+)